MSFVVCSSSITRVRDRVAVDRRQKRGSAGARGLAKPTVLKLTFAPAIRASALKLTPFVSLSLSVTCRMWASISTCRGGQSTWSNVGRDAGNGFGNVFDDDHLAGAAVVGRIALDDRHLADRREESWRPPRRPSVADTKSSSKICVWRPCTSGDELPGVGERRDENDAVAIDPGVIGHGEDRRERFFERDVAERDRDHGVDVVGGHDVEVVGLGEQREHLAERSVADHEPVDAAALALGDVDVGIPTGDRQRALDARQRRRCRRRRQGLDFGSCQADSHVVDHRVPSVRGRWIALQLVAWSVVWSLAAATHLADPLLCEGALRRGNRRVNQQHQERAPHESRNPAPRAGLRDR